MKSKTLIKAIMAILLGCFSCVSSRFAKAYDRTEKAYAGQERDTTSLAFIDMGEAIVAAWFRDIEKGKIPADYKEYTSLVQIDTIPVTNETQPAPPQRCSILPGKHTVELFHGQWDYLVITLGRYLVTFDAEAGKTYSIKTDADHEKREVDVYVIDANSRERIESTVEHKYTLKEKDKKPNNSLDTIQYQRYYHQGSSSRKVSRHAYAGPKQKKSSLAFVKGMDSHYKTKYLTKLIQVDTIPVANIQTTLKKIDILPGTHTIEIEQYQKKGLNRTLFIESYLVTFNAKIGKTYIIHADTDPETSVVDVYVTDADSGKRIESFVDYKFKFKEKE